jgi:uncharacterized membrane protein YcaP (DUF421 family)
MQALVQPKNGWFLLEVAGNTAIIYLFLVILIRVVGKRMLSQLSSLDLLAVVLLGSAVETSMVTASTRLEAGFVSGTVLLLLNKLLTFGMLRSRRLRNVVGGGPTVLVNHGQIVQEHLIRAGLTQADLMEALREREIGDLAKVRLAVMEPDGVVNIVAVGDTQASPNATCLES